MSDLVAITGLAVGGDGVGRLADGRAVFIPRTAPGDRVRVRDGTLKIHRKFARAEPGEIVQGAPSRVAPPCPHYVHDHCGGCQLQHVGYDAQLAAKRVIVGDTLRRIGKLDLPDPEIVEAVEEWRYRAKISMDVKRTAGRPDGGGLSVGLHPYDRPNFVFPLADCHITDFRLMALWREMRGHLDLLPPDATRVVLRLDREERRHIIVESPGDAWPDAGKFNTALAGAGQDAVIWWRGRVVGGESGGGGTPATAFEQVNPEMGSIVRRWAVDQLGAVRGQTVWDLFGGIGDTAALLAAAGASVVSVDADEGAIAWARSRVPDVRFIAARAEDVIAGLPRPYAVIVKPPRAGLEWAVTLRLTAEPVSRLVYVSCDPATLARDLNRLNVNYEITATRAFDLLPQTSHVETVVVMEAA